MHFAEHFHVLSVMRCGLVDRLLASPRYGERWARHWLDVVHYGETHGYDKDKPRAVGPAAGGAPAKPGLLGRLRGS